MSYKKVIETSDYQVIRMRSPPILTIPNKSKHHHLNVSQSIVGWY